MAQYDGNIRIKTDIDAKNAAVQLTALENRITKTADKITSLRSKMDSLKNAKIPTQEYSEISNQIEKAEQKFNKLLEKQEQMQREGKDNGVAWQRLNDQIDEVGNEIKYAKGELQELVDTGKSFTLGSDTEEFTRLSQQLQYTESDLSALNEKHDLLIMKQEQARDGYKRLGDAAKKSLDKINKAQQKATGLLGSFGLKLKSIISAVFIFNIIRRALNSMIKGIKEGFENLYNENDKFKNSIESLKASAATLKNSLAAAFAPLVEIAIPYIQRFIEWLTKAVDLMGQFIAALTGRKTYTKAIKQSAQASKEAAEAAEDETKAMNKQLSPLDKLNNLTSDKNEKSKDSGIGADAGVGTMFEEVPIDSGILDFINKLKDLLKPVIDYAKKLKDIFMQGFWDGLGDWQYRCESIKDSITSIKDSLIDIFTDPAVLAAADKWAQSFVYMLGSLVGSLASIGLTIAANILGGIAKYLEQNKDRIKKFLISMFDIWTEVNYLFADLFQSIAYVFEAFASEQAQQLTANLIGIFVDTFMGILELASKIFRDVARIMIQPFVDNKEALRTALEGFLGVLMEVTGTIKQGIDDTFDKLNEVYDAHFRPFFESVAQGLSDLVAKFLEFWNGNVQPILQQWAADFDELWKSHIQPLLNNAAEFLGKIADLLKVLWESYLQPLIAWIIDNVLPKLLPVIQAIWNTLKNLFGYIADMVSAVITILGGLIDFITGVFSGDWEKAFQGLQDMVGGFIDTIRITIEGGIQLISDLLNTFIEAAKAAIDLFLQAIEKTIEICLNWIQTNIVGKFNEIKTGFSNFKANITNTWTQTWQALYNKVVELINKIKSTISGAFDWISQKMSSISSSIGSFGSKISGMFKNYSLVSGIQIPVSPVVAALSNVEIPAYATGQVIPRTMKQHLAILGDNTQETEVVSPLSTIEQALENVISRNNGFSGGGDINLNLTVECEGYQLLNIMQKLDRQFYKQNGRHAFS